MSQKASLDKKMALAQYIREENHGNRMKIRQREKILYGTDTQPPLYNTGRLHPVETLSDLSSDNEMAWSASSGTFKYRMALAILMFVFFLFCDTGGNRIAGYTTSQIHDMILADTFHLYGESVQSTAESITGDTEEGTAGNTSGLAAWLDFGR